MINLGLVFFICFVAMAVSNFVVNLSIDSDSENFPIAITVISAFGSGAVVLILWLIEHVRFV